MKLKNISQRKRFRQFLLKIERDAILQSVETETLNFQVRLHFYGNFQKSVKISKTKWQVQQPLIQRIVIFCNQKCQI